MVVEWEGLALPVLLSLAHTSNTTVRDGYIGLGHGTGAEALELECNDGDLHDALLALQDADYIRIGEIEYAGGSSASVLGARVTGRGMQALGQWPSLQAAMTPITLATVLESLADYAPDDATRGRFEEAAGTVRKSGTNAVREAVVGFGAEALKAKLGLR